MIGFYDYTVIATYLATVLGVGGIFLAADGLHLPAVFCLLLAGLLDTFDGRIARTKKDRSEQQKHFGIQSDSLNDLIFLQRMYDAGAAPYFDIVAMQGYGLYSGPTDDRMQPRVINIITVS